MTLPFVRRKPIPDVTCGNAAYDRVRWHIVRHNAPGGNDGLTSDVYALQNDDISADPSAGSDRDIAVILRALVFLCQFRDVLSDSIYTMVAVITVTWGPMTTKSSMRMYATLDQSRASGPMLTRSPMRMCENG